MSAALVAAAILLSNLGPNAIRHRRHGYRSGHLLCIEDGYYRTWARGEGWGPQDDPNQTWNRLTGWSNPIYIDCP